MPSFIDHLRSFNRKERFFLVGMALGNPQFSLASEFRDSVGGALGLTVPEDALVAMDYHLDWIYASLYLHRHGGDRGPHPNLDKIVRAHQEDIDLLVAFQDRGACRVLLLEAKGATGWNNKQMTSKAARLKEIFGESGEAWPGIDPHFVIASPRRLRRLDTAHWPAWMLGAGEIPWIEMPMDQDLNKITRCTAEGVRSALGQHWKVIPA